MVNLTSGVFSDGDPGPFANALMQRGTHDGRVLLFHAYLSRQGNAQPLLFPDSTTSLPDASARVLFGSASELPRPIHEQMHAIGIEVPESARCMACNADLVRAILMGVWQLDLSAGPAARHRP